MIRHTLSLGVSSLIALGTLGAAVPAQSEILPTSSSPVFCSVSISDLGGLSTAIGNPLVLGPTSPDTFDLEQVVALVSSQVSCGLETPSITPDTLAISASLTEEDGSYVLTITNLSSDEALAIVGTEVAELLPTLMLSEPTLMSLGLLADELELSLAQLIDPAALAAYAPYIPREVIDFLLQVESQVTAEFTDDGLILRVPTTAAAVPPEIATSVTTLVTSQRRIGPVTYDWSSGSSEGPATDTLSIGSVSGDIGSITPAKGAPVSKAAPSGGPVLAQAKTAQAVPEPGTVAALGTLLLVGALGRKAKS